MLTGIGVGAGLTGAGLSVGGLVGVAAAFVGWARGEVALEVAEVLEGMADASLVEVSTGNVGPDGAGSDDGGPDDASPGDDGAIIGDSSEDAGAAAPRWLAVHALIATSATTAGRQTLVKRRKAIDAA